MGTHICEWERTEFIGGVPMKKKCLVTGITVDIGFGIIECQNDPGIELSERYHA